jgi:hypothetical protein
MRGRKRLEHMRNDPRVVLEALDDSDWYTHVSVTGHVEETREDTGPPASTARPGSTRADRTRSATAAGSAPGSPWTADTAGYAERQQPARLNECLIRPDQNRVFCTRRKAHHARSRTALNRQGGSGSMRLHEKFA